MRHFQPDDSCSLSSNGLRARLSTERQAEQQRVELRRQRCARIEAANDVVDAYLRKSGISDRSAAFAYVQRTRPDLFADMHEPGGLVPAANFNPNHDELGRFASGDGAGGGVNDGLDGQGGGKTKPKSIRGHAYDSRSSATCVAAAIRSMIATKHPDNVPSEEAIKAQLSAASKGIFTKAGEGINWNSGSGIAATSDHYGALVQKVLSDNGVQSTSQSAYDTMKQLSDALVNSGQPAMVNVQPTDGTGDHSVAAQWDPDAAGGEGRFLINNLTTKGYTDSFTREQFESGQLTSDIRDQGSIQSPKPKRYRVHNGYSVTIAK